MLGASFCCKIYLKTSCLTPVFVVKFISRFVLVKTLYWKKKLLLDLGSSSHAAPNAGADLGGDEMTCGFLIQLVFCKKKLCGLLVLKKSKRRVHSLQKKSWIRPCNAIFAM